jgi:hypothetical protein
MSREDFGYVFANPQFHHPPSEHPYGSPLQFPHPAPAPADTHYRNASPPLENPLPALLKSRHEKEPGLLPNESSRTGTPNAEREGRPALLPSPMFRSSSRASVLSHKEGTAMEPEDGAKDDDDNDQSNPDALSKSGTDSASF